jgi:hypothetical protein
MSKYIPKCQPYNEGDPIPEGFVVAKNVNGVTILRKSPKSGEKRKRHTLRDADGNVKKTQIQMKNFYEGRLGIPCCKNGRPRKNGFWPTPENPGGAGKPLKYPTPQKLSYAFDRALQRLANSKSPITKLAFLVELGMSNSMFEAYRHHRGEGFSLVCERAEDIFELYLQDQALTHRNTNAVSMIKMYHDRAEKQDISITAKSKVDEMSEDQLRKIAEQATEEDIGAYSDVTVVKE